MDKYKVFLYKNNPLDISGDIASALWVLLVQLPFNLFSFILQLLTHVLKVLDLGSFLSGLQNAMITTSKTIFESLIGGKTSTGIGVVSFVGLAIVLMAVYLLYQFTNGKGRFVSSLLHFLCIFVLVFFYFGTISGTGVQTQTGGAFLFQTVQKVTTSAQEDISRALHPTLGSNDPTKVFTTYLKETANYLNTGNVDGELKDGTSFDYFKASGKDGESYISDLEQDTPYLQANNEVLIQKVTFGFIQSLNAYIMVLPMAVIAILISVLSIVLLILILLFPLTAALSFFPFFRNAAISGLKKMILLIAMPAGLSILLSILLYMMKQVDGPVNQAVAATNIPESFRFLVTIIVEVFLKGTLLYGLWRYRDSVLDFLTGSVIRENGFANQLLQEGKEVMNTTVKVGSQAVNAAQGAALLGAGTAMMAGGGIVVAGGSLAGNKSLTDASLSNVVQKGESLASAGLEHFMSKDFKEKLDGWRGKHPSTESENEEEPDSSTGSISSDFIPDSSEEESSEKDEQMEKENSDVYFEDFQTPEEEAIDPFVHSDEMEDGMNQTETAESFDSLNNETDDLVLEEGMEVEDLEEIIPQDNQWESAIDSEYSNEEWIGAFQDLQEEREGE